MRKAIALSIDALLAFSMVTAAIYAWPTSNPSPQYLETAVIANDAANALSAKYYGRIDKDWENFAADLQRASRETGYCLSARYRGRSATAGCSGREKTTIAAQATMLESDEYYRLELSAAS